MAIYAMTPKTTVTHNGLGGNINICCSSLSAFAGDLVGLVQQVHKFLCTNPQDNFTKHFSFTYDGVEVVTHPSKHTQFMDDVSALIDLLPVAYSRLVESDPSRYQRVGSFKENQILRDFEYRLKEARNLAAQQIVRNSENALDMAYLRDILASCHTQPLVNRALIEGWTREQNISADFTGCCQGDGWVVFDPSKVDARTAVRQFEPKSFVVDLTSVMISNEQLDTLVKDLNGRDIATAKHEKGVVIYYVPYFIDEHEGDGF